LNNYRKETTFTSITNEPAILVTIAMIDTTPTLRIAATAKHS